VGTIKIVKGSLFNAPADSILIHACNTQGVWGAGIARQFAELFPGAYRVYRLACMDKKQVFVGSCLLIPSKSYWIGCLFTSKSYGRQADSPDKILSATRLAIADLVLQNTKNRPMHMCKINSGLFGVPWKDTRAVLEEFDAEFVVYDL
jgi:ADP-ribose 1''-phosphate phosphatase